jgi:hypothetical protein
MLSLRLALLFESTLAATAATLPDTHAARNLTRTMRLVPCSPPSEPLDAAPRTALLRDAEPGTDWQGFWSHSSDAYYTRCTTREGATHWYRITDETMEVAGTAPRVSATRVLPFRGSAMRRIQLILAASPNGRPMLVGSARRAGK